MTKAERTSRQRALSLYYHSILYPLSHLIIPGVNEFRDVDEGQLLRDRFEWRRRGLVRRKGGGTQSNARECKQGGNYSWWVSFMALLRLILNCN